MQIEGSTILVTGANRGIGRALVDAALERDAARVYIGTRRPFEPSEPRVVPLQIDVTDAQQVAAAAAQIDQLDILINNAGIAQYDDLSDPSALEAHLAVNLFGTHRVTQAFLRALERAGGTLVNNVSMMALAPFPVTPAYAVSKAAAFNLTQSLRALLGPRGITVQAVLTGPTDTDMAGLRDSEGVPGVRRAGDPGWDRGGGGGDLPRPAVGSAGRQLARRSGQGLRASVRARRGCLNRKPLTRRIHHAELHQ
jgi:NAD(P)-dependent dehydrogenase (short-subunit alcohol dehydrogenase family)